MLIIAHRVNTIEGLKAVPHHYGVEIDIRGVYEDMFLHHDPLKAGVKYDNLADYLAVYEHAFVIFNTKEMGYEQRIIDVAAKHGIENYFLLDEEFPYIYRATRKEGVRKIAVRYSEAEPIEMCEAQVVEGKTLFDWVWIDTNTTLPLDADVITRFKQLGVKTALVCPERWGRPDDIAAYQAQMDGLGFKPDAVMTSMKCAPLWEVW